MYLFIPVALLIVSLLAIWYIVSRKFVYLKKLTPEAISNPAPTAPAFWAELFPELITAFGKINWREYRLKITAESEKLLRRLRLVFLKIETITHNLSLKLRRSKEKHEELLVQEEIKKEEVKEVKIEEKIDPKEEEQHLIMEIAKNPKDYLLYLKLGDIYLKTGEIENARASFETVLQLDPENWYARGKLKSLPKKPDLPT